MSLALQLGAEFSEVVDLAVVNDAYCAILVTHGHMAAWRKINDGEALAAQTNVGAIWEALFPHAAVIRAAVKLNRSHPSQNFATSAVNESTYSAHARRFPWIRNS